jgi:hypothetical protein
VRVWRRDWPRPAVGVARWSEYVQTTRDGNPTRFWRQMPHNQLAKCAEALALRKAFPAVLAKLYTPEEMAQADNGAPAPGVALAPAAPAPAALPAPRPVPPAPGSSPVVSRFAAVCDALDKATTIREVNAAAALAGKAHKAGHLSDAELEQVRASVLALRESLAPAAPPSAPESGEVAT